MAKRGNGEGSIIQRPDGRWMARASVGHDPKTGKLIRRTFYGKTRATAAKQLTDALAAAGRGQTAPSAKLTLGEWLARWIETYARPKVRQRTFESYESMIRVHIAPALGNVKLRDLRPEHLQRFLNDKLTNGAVRREGGLAARSVHIMHVVLHAALKQAVREGLVPVNAADAVSPPRVERHEIRPPTPEEMAQVLEAIRGHRLFALYLLDWATGLRRGESLALRWQDVDLERSTMTIARNLIRTREHGLVFTEPKTSLSRRTVPLPPIAARELIAHKARQAAEKESMGSAYEDQDLVFATPNGRPIDPDNASHTFKRLLAQAGLPTYRLHDLRHAFASHLLYLGVHPKVVQALLGHSTINLTMNTYSHLTPGLMEQAAAQLNAAMESVTGMVAALPPAVPPKP